MIWFRQLVTVGILFIKSIVSLPTKCSVLVASWCCFLEMIMVVKRSIIDSQHSSLSSICSPWRWNVGMTHCACSKDDDSSCGCTAEYKRNVTTGRDASVLPVLSLSPEFVVATSINPSISIVNASRSWNNNIIPRIVAATLNDACNTVVAFVVVYSG